MEKNEARVSGLEKGFMPIYEPNLEEMVARGTEVARLVREELALTPRWSAERVQGFSKKEGIS